MLMVSIKNVRLFYNTPKGIFKITLCLTLMVFVLTMTPASSFLQIIKPAMAAGLTGVYVVPASNIVNERATYAIFLKLATTATIETILINFPPSFDLAVATRLIENSGIGSGSLSVSGSTLEYIVSNPVSVSAGTNIKLEIGRVVANTPGSFTVSVSTLNSGGGTIDGPTSSSSFTIKSITSSDIADNTIHNSDILDNTVAGPDIKDRSISAFDIEGGTITGNEISPAFMIRKTLLDDLAGHAKFWDPDGVKTFIPVLDSDLTGSFTSNFVDIDVNGANCSADLGAFFPSGFGVRCSSPIPNNSQLQYIITKLPGNIVTSSLSVSSSTISSPFDSIGPND